MKSLTFFAIPLLGIAVMSLFNCSRKKEELDSKIYFPTQKIISLESPAGQCTIQINRPSKWNGSTIIYLHGAWGDENSWTYHFPHFYLNTKGNPIMVSLSFGPRWFLTDSSNTNPSMSKFFWSDIIPMVLEEIPEKTKIIGLGFSMGGFNLLSLLNDNPSFFESAILINPAIANISPWAPKDELITYADRTKAYSNKQYLISLFNNDYRLKNTTAILDNWRQLVDSDLEWSKLNPLKRSETIHSIRSKILIVSSQKDGFGFQEGASTLYDLLKNKTDVQYHKHKGKHMDINWEAVKSFLVTQY